MHPIRWWTHTVTLHGVQRGGFEYAQDASISKGFKLSCIRVAQLVRRTVNGCLIILAVFLRWLLCFIMIRMNDAGNPRYVSYARTKTGLDGRLLQVTADTPTTPRTLTFETYPGKGAVQSLPGDDCSRVGIFRRARREEAILLEGKLFNIWHRCLGTCAGSSSSSSSTG